MELPFIILISYGVLLGLLLINFIAHSYYLKFLKVRKASRKTLQNSTILNKFIVLIPARYESKVIENLLKSLKEQTYNSSLFDVYIITESEKDKTNSLALKYDYHYIIREKIRNRKTKGFALQDGYNYLKDNNISFDAVIILDADNVLDSNYLYEMNILKNDGYDIGVGFRKSTNANKNLISASSSLLFTYQSLFVNHCRTNLFKKFAISGTGYFISKNVLELSKGWIWTGLTEDVELTRFAYANDINMGFNENAIFYDEQPIDYKTMHKQHVRWVWGYYNKDRHIESKKINDKIVKNLANHEYLCAMNLFMISEAINVLHIVFSIIMTLYSFILGYHYDALIYFILIFVDILLILLFCNLATLFEILVTKKDFKISKLLKFKVVNLGFVFWSDFLFAYLDGFFNKSKRKKREKIKHKGEIIDEDSIE